MNKEPIIRREILMSAKRMVEGLEMVEREQRNIQRHITALEIYGGIKSLSLLASQSGVAKQLISGVLSGQKKIGPDAARKLAATGPQDSTE